LVFRLGSILFAFLLVSLFLRFYASVIHIEIIIITCLFFGLFAFGLLRVFLLRLLLFQEFDGDVLEFLLSTLRYSNLELVAHRLVQCSLQDSLESTFSRLCVTQNDAALFYLDYFVHLERLFIHFSIVVKFVFLKAGEDKLGQVAIVAALWLQLGHRS